MSNIRPVSRKQGELLKRNAQNNSSICAIDVSSYAEYPFCNLSPFAYSQEYEIPVPGMENQKSHSVEGIWQGLKVIDGEIDTRMFRNKPHKRKGPVEGHKYGDELLGYQDARELLFIPSYDFFLIHHAPQEAIQYILSKQREGAKVHLYDVDSNFDIRNPAPLAHSALLATYLNLIIFNQSLEPSNEHESRLVEIMGGNSPLAEKAATIESLLGNDGFMHAFTYWFLEHPRDADYFRVAEAVCNSSDLR